MKWIPDRGYQHSSRLWPTIPIPFQRQQTPMPNQQHRQLAWVSRTLLIVSTYEPIPYRKPFSRMKNENTTTKLALDSKCMPSNGQYNILCCCCFVQPQKGKARIMFPVQMSFFSLISYISYISYLYYL